jgi:hypothetical protein
VELPKFVRDRHADPEGFANGHPLGGHAVGKHLHWAVHNSSGGA